MPTGSMAPIMRASGRRPTHDKPGRGLRCANDGSELGPRPASRQDVPERIILPVPGWAWPKTDFREEPPRWPRNPPGRSGSWRPLAWALLRPRPCSATNATSGRSAASRSTRSAPTSIATTSCPSRASASSTRAPERSETVRSRDEPPFRTATFTTPHGAGTRPPSPRKPVAAPASSRSTCRTARPARPRPCRSAAHPRGSRPR